MKALVAAACSRLGAGRDHNRSFCQVGVPCGFCLLPVLLELRDGGLSAHFLGCMRVGAPTGAGEQLLDNSGGRAEVRRGDLREPRHHDVVLVARGARSRNATTLRRRHTS